MSDSGGQAALNHHNRVKQDERMAQHGMVPPALVSTGNAKYRWIWRRAYSNALLRNNSVPERLPRVLSCQEKGCAVRVYSRAGEFLPGKPDRRSFGTNYAMLKLHAFRSMCCWVGQYGGCVGKSLSN